MKYKAIIFIYLLFIAGCAEYRQPKSAPTSKLYEDFACEHIKHPETPMEKHVLRINRDGLVIGSNIKNPKPGSAPLDETEAQNKIYTMLCEAEKMARSQPDFSQTKRVKVLIFVHGGLNTYKTTDKRIMRDMHKNIMHRDESSDDWSYPIFVSWPSGVLSTWGESTFLVREGKRTNPGLGVATSPLIITSELLTSVGDLPRTMLYQVANEKDRVASAGWLPNSWISRSWKSSKNQICAIDNKASNDCPVYEYGQKIKANLSNFTNTTPVLLRNGTYQTVTLPIRYTIGSLWHSAIAESSWKNMVRRTNNMFYPPHDFDIQQPEGLRGGKLFEILLKRAAYQKQKNGIHYEVTLVGHSMGTIVINNALNTYQSQWLKTTSIQNIVYLAAACSIDDAVKAVHPIISSKNSGEKHQVNFYNLTLNRVAEVAEMHYGAVVPTGSLLVSIDQHYERPSHPMSRTMGSEVNVLSAMDRLSQVFADSKGKVIFKSFDKCRNSLPSKHGDFGDIPFWKRQTWELNSTSEFTPGAPYNKKGELIKCKAA